MRSFVSASIQHWSNSKKILQIQLRWFKNFQDRQCCLRREEKLSSTLWTSEIRIEFHEIDSLTWSERFSHFNFSHFRDNISLPSTHNNLQWHAMENSIKFDIESAVVYSIHVSHMLRRLMFHITLYVLSVFALIAAEESRLLAPKKKNLQQKFIPNTQNY